MRSATPRSGATPLGISPPTSKEAAQTLHSFRRMARRRKSTRVLAIFSLFVLATGSALAAQRQILVTLSPKAEHGEIETVQVEQVLEGFGAVAGKPFLMVPRRIAFTPGEDYQPDAVSANDTAGPLKLELTNVPAPAGSPVEMQIFVPTRDSVGAIQLHYQARVRPSMAPRKRGPSYDLRGTDGGFGGSFFSFLLLPDQGGTMDFDLKWDFAELAPGALAVTTAQVGNYHAEVDT
ncbi:MAG: hypothetical protein QM601_03990, partial [Pseudoxanthomonas sp.]